MLKDDLRMTIETLMKRGASLREIARATGVSRNTISSHIRRAAPGVSNTVATQEAAAETRPRPPAAPKKPTDSVCRRHGSFTGWATCTWRLGLTSMDRFRGGVTES